VALGPAARVFGHAVGLDMTRRDLQAAAKKLGRPWDVAKGFDHSAPIGAILPAETALASGAITLDVNGQRRQTGDLAEMIWSVPEIIVELGKLFTLQPGDLIFTGTPSGVGPVARGDRLHAEIAGVGALTVDVI
jgi:fumarylpyruvate hydrolase